MHTPRQVLQEARDTIAATYWISGDEFKFAHGEEELSKFITVNRGGKQEKLVGLCSIGAMSLATSIVTMDELENFGTLVEHDWATFMAGLALCRVIQPRQKVFMDLAELIATWNDGYEESGPIIEGFDAALTGPDIDREDVYCIFAQGRHRGGLFYNTRAEAEDALAEYRTITDEQGFFVPRTPLQTQLYDELAAESSWIGVDEFEVLPMKESFNRNKVSA